MAAVFKIRYNTDFPAKSKYAWRVIEIKESEWKEILTTHVSMNVSSETTTDTLLDGRIKHHITIKPMQVIFDTQNEDGGFEKIVFS